MTHPPDSSDPTAPHSAVAYILPAVHSKRVRLLAADGAEEDADDNPWVRMQLKDPFQQTQPEDAAASAAAETAADADGAAAAAAAGEENEEQPRPEEVIKSFAAAKGELEWLLALLNTLQEAKYLTVGRSERGKSQQDKAQIFADLASQANSRFRRRSAAAAAASAALEEGAAALRALGRKEDAFYAQVAQLQRYWKVRQEPASSPYAYSVNLSLAPPDNSSSSAAAGPDSAAMVGRGPVDVVYILKDPAGNLRVQVPVLKTPGPPTVTFKGLEQPPAVYTGPAAIHALLLQQLRLNAWHMVVNSLDEEIANMLNLPGHLKHALSMPLRQQSQGAQQILEQQQQQQQGPKFAEMSGHLALFASLSSLVLQAVAGAAGTAGETAILQQQQRQRQQQVDHMAVDTPGPDAIMFDLDVGQPWQHAAAAGGSVGQAASSGSNAGSNGSIAVPRLVVDPQLLSMRPLALDHLLVTQLGHLVASLRHTNDPMLMAPIAYAAAARQMQDRVRQRLQQHQQQQSSRSDEAAGAGPSSAAAGAAHLGLKPGSMLFGRQVSFLHCCARWLQHAAHRDVLRAQVDGVLAGNPGVVSRYLPSTHFCVSAMQVGRSSTPAAAAAGLDRGGPRQQQQQRSSSAAAAVAPQMTVLLSDGQLSIETPGLTAGSSAAAGGREGVQGAMQGAEQWLSPAAPSAMVVQLQGVPAVLENLLQQL